MILLIDGALLFSSEKPLTLRQSDLILTVVQLLFCFEQVVKDPNFAHRLEMKTISPSSHRYWLYYWHNFDGSYKSAPIAAKF